MRRAEKNTGNPLKKLVFTVGIGCLVMGIGWFIVSFQMTPDNTYYTQQPGVVPPGLRAPVTRFCSGVIFAGGLTLNLFGLLLHWLEKNKWELRQTKEGEESEIINLGQPEPRNKKLI